MGFLTFFSPLFCITFSLFSRFIGRMVGIFLHTFNTATLLRETKLPQILWIGYWKRVLYNVYRKKLLRKNKQVENRTKNLNLFNSPTKTHLKADCLETMEISFKYPAHLLCTCVNPEAKQQLTFPFKRTVSRSIVVLKISHNTGCNFFTSLSTENKTY